MIAAVRAPASRRRSRPKVGFVSLGCAKALVDSERILTGLRTQGYEIASTYRKADVVVVNTCGFLISARQESLEGDRRERQGDRHRLPGCGTGRDPRHPSRGARGHRAASLGRSAGGRASGGDAAACPLPRAGAPAGPAADARPLRSSQDFRGLQPSVQLLHHPEAARRPGQPGFIGRAARGRGAGRRRREGAAGRLAGHLGLWRRPRIPDEPVARSRGEGTASSISPTRWATSGPGCGSATSIPTRMSTRSSWRCRSASPPRRWPPRSAGRSR